MATAGRVIACFALVVASGKAMEYQPQVAELGEHSALGDRDPVAIANAAEDLAQAREALTKTREAHIAALSQKVYLGHMLLVAHRFVIRVMLKHVLKLQKPVKRKQC